MRLLKSLAAFIGLIYLLRYFYDEVTGFHVHKLAEEKRSRGRKKNRRGGGRKTTVKDGSGMRHSRTTGRGVVHE